MKTVKEVSQLTGVSVRTLHHYDAIGLLKPARSGNGGYRLYSGNDLERLQLILFFRELQFPLKAIPAIIDSPDFDRNRALQQQVELLTLRKQHLENLILMARGIQLLGVKNMNFGQFDVKKIDDYTAQAKALWGNSPAYREYEEKAKGRTKQEDSALGEEMMDIFARLGAACRCLDPGDSEAQALVEELRQFINQHFYTCTPKILQSLGQMYAGGGSFTESIDQAGGKGTAEFTHQAIDIYCKNH